MNVIGAGFGRTGTLSLKLALEQLGFDPCYHMQEVIKRPTHIRLWQEIASGEEIPWPQIFEQFAAGVDFPVSNYYQELLQAYPTAKVILTVRDPERWYESTLNTIYQMNKMPAHLFWFIPPLAQFDRMTRKVIWDGLFHGRFEDKAYAIKIFNDHILEVKQTVPAEQLLVFHPRDGWEPLCEFLDVPVPKGKPFPHVNDRAQMSKRLQVLKVMAIVLPVITLAGVAAVLGAGYRWLRSGKRSQGT